MLAKFFVNWNYNTVKNAVFSYYEKRGDEIRCIDEELPFEIPDRWEWMQLEIVVARRFVEGNHRSILSKVRRLFCAEV